MNNYYTGLTAMEKYFYEMFDNMPRLGPGEKQYTLEALNKLKNLPSDAKLLDIGCGTGMQTFHLAENNNFSITATDNYQDFLDILNQRACDENLSHRIKTETADMNRLPYDDEQFDLLWAEGSIFIIGFEQGLKQWKRLIKPNGYLVISECAWTKENRPQEAIDFWNSEYPSLKTHDENKQIISDSGYKLIDSFPLPAAAWIENYYIPLQSNLLSIREKYADNPDALALFDATQHEIDVFYKHNDCYGYYFYLMQKI